MPSYFVVQPDGRLARFSTVVDDFTALNMTEAEAVQLVTDEAAERGKIEAERGIEWAKSRPDKWEDCLATVAAVHGAGKWAERQEQSKEPS